MGPAIIKGVDYLNKAKTLLDESLRRLSPKSKGETPPNTSKSKKSKSKKTDEAKSSLRSDRLGKADAVAITVSVLEATDIFALTRNLGIYGTARLAEKLYTPVAGRNPLTNKVAAAKKKVIEEAYVSSKRANALGTEQGELFVKSNARIIKAKLKQIKDAEKARKSNQRQKRKDKDDLAFNASDASKLEKFFGKLENAIAPNRAGTKGPKGKNTNKRAGESKTSEKFRALKEHILSDGKSPQNALIGSGGGATGYILLDELFGSDPEYLKFLESNETNSTGLFDDFKELLIDNPAVMKFLDDNKLDANESDVIEHHLNNDEMFDKSTFNNVFDTLITKQLQKATASVKRDKSTRKSTFIPKNTNIIRSARVGGVINVPIMKFEVGAYLKSKTSNDINSNSKKHILATRYGITPDEYDNVKELMNELE